MIRYPEQILIRLEKGQNEVLKREADRFGLSVSSYVRLRLFNNDLIDLTQNECLWNWGIRFIDFKNIPWKK